MIESIVFVVVLIAVCVFARKVFSTKVAHFEATGFLGEKYVGKLTFQPGWSAMSLEDNILTYLHEQGKRQVVSVIVNKITRYES